MKKRFLAFLLAASLLLSVSALADEPVEVTAEEPEETADETVRMPVAVYAREDGALLVSDAWNKVVWLWRDGAWELFAGNIGVEDLSGEPSGLYHDGDKEHSYFMEPWGIAPYLDGWAVADAGANVVRYVTDKGIQTLAGSGKEGKQNGVAGSVRFSRPTGLASDGKNLYVADTGNGAIRRITEKGQVTTWAEGLSEPMAIAWHDGALYVAETGANRILKLTDGKSEVLAGTAQAAEDTGVYYGGFVDGPAEKARFDHPQGIAVAEDGTVYVSDSLNHAVRKFSGGRVYTLAQSSDLLTMPLLPRGLVLTGGTLRVADTNGRDLLSLDVAAKTFEDVKDTDWFAAWAGEAAARGMVKGTTDTTFSPDTETSRAMFVTMLSRVRTAMDGSLVIDGEQTFPDVPEKGWFSGAARWSADMAIVNGIDGNFQPDAPITREQLVTMLYRFAKSLELDVSVGEDTNILSYEDAFDVAEWAVEAFQWACGAGIISGSDKGELLPQNTADRAQTAKILVAFMDAYGL